MKVNCWFCNQNSSVPYENYNSFVCKKCDQYNGFTADGDYNREIPEQHSSKLNAMSTAFCARNERRMPRSNGLCDTCNRNQEMKVIQLANFRPRCESTFDEEIEEYKQKLDDSYQLCQACSGHVSKTLNRIKTKFIGSKFAKFMQPKLHNMTEYVHVNILDKFVIIALMLLSIGNITREFDIEVEIPNERVRTFYFHLIALRLTIVDIVGNLLRAFTTELTLDGLATTAIALNSWIFYRQSELRLQTIVSLMLWSIFMLIDELPISVVYFKAIRGSFALFIAALTLLTVVKCFRAKKSVINNGQGNFHRMTNSLIECDDSDNEMDLSSSQQNGSIAYSISQPSTIVSYSPSASNYNNRTVFMNGSALDKTLTYPQTRLIQNSSRPFDSVSTYSNRTFSIRDEVTAADRQQVQKDITKLNLNDHFGSSSTLNNFNTSRYLNPFALENSRCGSPAPSIASVFSGSNRSQIVSPPRLDSSNKGEANWIAGGFWSSPQKQTLDVNHMNPIAEMSRSSSQSSGLGTNDSGKNSRENSIYNEDFNASLFSAEPVRRRNLLDKSAFSFDKTSSPVSRSLFSQTYTHHPKPNSFFPTNNLNGSFKKYRDT